MEQPGSSASRRIAIALAGGVLAVALAWGVVRRVGTTNGGTGSVSATTRGYLVEVLNATSRPGLARQVTRLLRERGVDVIAVGTLEAGADSTTVLVRRGEMARGREVARFLGVDRVVSRPDPKPRVDVTVVVGADFRFPKGWLPL